MKQPEGLHGKPLVIKEEVTLTGDIQGNSPAWLLLWVQGSAVSGQLVGVGVTKQKKDEMLKKKKSLRKNFVHPQVLSSIPHLWTELPFLWALVTRWLQFMYYDIRCILIWKRICVYIQYVYTV